MSITFTIFSANASPSEPPNTVKSCEKTNTRRPSMVPWPVTTPSPSGRCSIIEKLGLRWRTNASSSTNDPGSSSRSMRSRASSLPRSCWRRTACSASGVQRLLAQLLDALDAAFGGAVVHGSPSLPDRPERPAQPGATPSRAA